MRIAVIHDTDNDGFMAAAVIKNRYPQADFFPARTYDLERLKDLPRLLHGYDDIYMVDLSAPVEVMDAIANEAQGNFFWFDHHPSAADLFGKYAGNQMIGKSACLLTFEWLYPNEGLPEAVDFTNRYDLFIQQDGLLFANIILPFQCIMERLRSVELYRLILISDEDEFERLVELGEALWVEEQRAFESAEKLSFRWLREKSTLLKGLRDKPRQPYKFVLTRGMRNPGRVAWLLRQGGATEDFYINQNEKNGKFTHSIRSLSQEADCLDFIKEFRLKGGGHHKAAGFSSEFNLFT